MSADVSEITFNDHSLCNGHCSCDDSTDVIIDVKIGDKIDDEDLKSEPILTPSNKRFVVYPIEYPDLWQLYKKAQGNFRVNKVAI